jgi:GNAT superfamily N-acetyltransferase
MGRLAVDQAFKGQGLGGALLADALGRAARAASSEWVRIQERPISPPSCDQSKPRAGPDIREAR